MRYRLGLFVAYPNRLRISVDTFLCHGCWRVSSSADLLGADESGVGDHDNTDHQRLRAIFSSLCSLEFLTEIVFRMETITVILGEAFDGWNREQVQEVIWAILWVLRQTPEEVAIERRPPYFVDGNSTSNQTLLRQLSCGPVRVCQPEPGGSNQAQNRPIDNKGK